MNSPAVNVMKDTARLGQWKALGLLVISFAGFLMAFRSSNWFVSATLACSAVIFLISSHDALYARDKRQARRLEERKYG